MNVLATLFVLLAVALMAGCDKDEIHTYSIPTPAVASVAVAEPNPVQWKLPAGWKPLPAHEMRYAGFSISDSDPQAMVTVAQAFGSLQMNVQRWEKQLDLPPTPEDQIGSLVQLTQVAGGPAALIDLSSKSKAEGGNGQRIRVAIIRRGNAPWFFKLSGASETVAAQSANFDAFLASVHFTDAPTDDAASDQPDAQADAGPSSNAPAAGSDPGITYTAPGDWVSQPVTDGFRVLLFKAGSGPQQADASVAKLVKNSGTILDNVNRWRGQIGLKPVDDISKVNSEQRTVGGEAATVFDLAGAASGKRLIVALVPHGEFWWFFKLNGMTEAVGAQKAAFDSFLASIQFQAN